MPTLPILVTTTHSGRAVPYEVLVDMLGAAAGDPKTQRARIDWLYRQNDPFTDQLFHLPGATNVHAVVSRFVVDLNRDRDDVGPNGVVKRTDFDLMPLYPEAFDLAAAAEERLARYWDPFHATVRRSVESATLLIDGHAMTAEGPSLGPDAGVARPAFCLMNGGDASGEAIDEHGPSLSPHVARAAVDLLWPRVRDLVQAAPGVPHEITLNRPFATGGVLRRYGQVGGLPAIGVEINRALYLDDSAPMLSPRHDRIGQLGHALRAFAADLLALLA